MNKRLLLVCGVAVMILTCACSAGIIHLPPQGSETPDIQLKTATYRPFRVIQVCLDTPPLYPSTMFHQAVNKIADWIEADATVNQGGFVVYVGEITSRSFQSGVIDPIQVPAFPADEIEPTPQPTYTPLPGQNGYQASDIQATRDAANDQAHTTWQKQLKSNHAAIAAALASVKEVTKKLRALVPPYDNKAADVYGCLADASQHFQNTQGEHDLVIASAFVNNTSVNQTSAISLAHAHIRGIYRDCSQAQLCTDHDTQWKSTFIQLGAAQDVAFYDPPQSELLTPLF